MATLSLLMPSIANAEEDFEAIRADVRTPPSSPPVPPPPTPSSAPARQTRQSQDDYPGEQAEDDLQSSLMSVVLVGAGVVVTSPFWIPRALLEDKSLPGTFPRYPYDHTRGFLLLKSWPGLEEVQQKPLIAEQFVTRADPNTLPYAAIGSQIERLPPTSSLNGLPDFPAGEVSTIAQNPVSSGPIVPDRPPIERNWACQVRADYLDEFDTISGFGGQMVFETASRFGVDASFEHLRERCVGGDIDHLTLGDANITYRFAQSERVQLRSGIGVNWLHDTRQTDLGFNFTYGGDFFPRRPWVVSAAIDWGTLGYAGLFRFRTTAGILVNRFETYIGYEYSDIGRTQDNALLAGVRIWF